MFYIAHARPGRDGWDMHITGPDGFDRWSYTNEVTGLSDLPNLARECVATHTNKPATGINIRVVFGDEGTTP